MEIEASSQCLKAGVVAPRTWVIEDQHARVLGECAILHGGEHASIRLQAGTRPKEGASADDALSIPGSLHACLAQASACGSAKRAAGGCMAGNAGAGAAGGPHGANGANGANPPARWATSRSTLTRARG